MKTNKIRLGILFGGQSAEHEISLLSARAVITALDPEKYDIVLIGIDKQGKWHLRDHSSYLAHSESPKTISLNTPQEALAFASTNVGKELVRCHEGKLSDALALDVVFPVLHGTYGEDGTVQGLLKLANIPFVGAGVLGSAVGMDKDVMKRLLRDAHIPVARFLTVRRHESMQWTFEKVAEQLGSPFFVKPANLGSSVGVAKISSEAEFASATQTAFAYDHKILFEECIVGRELVCAVLGNEHPVASVPGEIIPHHTFYSYEAKYLDAQGASYHIPASVSAECAEQIATLSIDVYKALCCEGLARIDFFLRPNGELIVNELNSLPGFTPNSTYPRLWAASGVNYRSLLDRLVELAIDRHYKERQLKTTF